MMNFVTIFLNKTERFSIDLETKFQKISVTIPVSNGLAEYEEFYEISEGELELFTNDDTLLKSFVHDCKNRKNDDRLLYKPGRLRGYP
jgi:hypothetical protein